MLAGAQDQGEVSPSLTLPRMTLHFAMTTAQQTDLQTLLQQLVDHKSSQYHKWLTPEEYADRFGMNSADLEKVTAWLEQKGFTNVEVARGRTFVRFSGSATQVNAAFQTSLHQYNINSETHYANSSDPYLPRALQGMVSSIRGLTDFHPKPHLVTSLKPHFTSSISGSHFLTPDDFATIYDLQTLYSSGITGSGQKIAIPGQSDITLSDIQNFRTAAGLSQNNPTVIVDGTDPGLISSYQSEAELDIEWAGGVARNATIIYVNATDAFDAVTYAVDNNLAPILSITYGNCEANIGAGELNSLNSLFQQASAQGMSVLAASGDSGAADCEDSASVATTGLAVDFPASSPYVTGVGGTTFSEGSGSYWSSTNDSYNGSALSYIPEVAWNDSSSSGLAATGGGASSYFSKPSWQAGTGVPADGFRDVPDVAFAASPNHDGYLVCSGTGSCASGFRYSDTTLDVVGGTSAAAPSFAGILALLNQKYNDIQGNVNPTLYAVSSFSTNAFHDIVSGNNIVSCRANTTNCGTSLQFGYSAGTGYDQVTGLGSVDGNNLINEWTADFGISLSPASLTITHGTSGTVAVNVTKDGNFNGTVSFTCSVASNLTNTTCSIPGTVTGSGTATMTISAGSTAAVPHWWSFSKFPHSGAPGLIAFAGLFLCGSAYLLSGKRRLPNLALAGGLSLMVFMASCGDGSSSSTSSTVSSTASPTLTVTATPATLTLAPGASGTVTAVVTPGGSYSAATTLSVSGAPSGVTAGLSSSSIAAPGSGSIPVTIAVGSGTVAGTYPLTITATGAGITATATVNLIVSPSGVITVTATSGTVQTTATLALTIN